MAHPITSKKRAQTLSTVLFLIGLAVLIFTEEWWPGLMLVVGLPLALRQYLMGRTYDMAISLLVFVGTYVTVAFDISWVSSSFSSSVCPIDSVHSRTRM